MESNNNRANRIYDALRRGDARVQARIWEDYYPGLLRVARAKLAGFPCRAFDEEDVVLAALESFFDSVRSSKIYPWQSDRELNQLLRTITCHTASMFRRREMRVKRGGGNVRGDSVFMVRSKDNDHASGGRYEPVDEHTSPTCAVVRAEASRRVLDALPDEMMREIVRLRLIGYTNNEIALTLGCARRTVERKVQRIRMLLTRAGVESASIV